MQPLNTLGAFKVPILRLLFLFETGDAQLQISNVIDFKKNPQRSIHSELLFILMCLVQSYAYLF